MKEFQSRGRHVSLLLGLCALVFFAAPVSVGFAQSGTGVAPELEISGFFDVLGSYSRAQENRAEFQLGQAEVDLESELSDRSAVSVAVAYNPDAEAFELGAAELALRIRKPRENSALALDLVAGQFDVPFGIDYQFYASADRRLITAPWFYEATGDGWRGWNDVGVRLEGAGERFNFAAYWVNGFEASATITERVLNLSTGLLEDVETEINTTPRDAFGAHAGYSPLEGLEVGASLALGMNASGKEEMLLRGIDAQYSYQQWSFKGEYASHSVNRSVSRDDHNGYYLQGLYQFSSLYAVARYSSFTPHGAGRTERISLGAGTEVAPNVEFRVENVIAEGSFEDMTLLQLVSTF